MKQRSVPMLSIHMLQPYYVKEEVDRIRIVLAYQYFAIKLNCEIYQFVPLESREIEVDQTTSEVMNKNANFIFQNGNKYQSFMLIELLQLPDFFQRLQEITSPYVKPKMGDYFDDEVNSVIYMLEKENMKRLIDHSLDQKDIKQFIEYSTLFNNM